MGSNLMRKYYCFGGETVCISGKPEELFLEDGILAPFRVAEGPASHRLCCEIVDRLSPAEGEVVFRDAERRVYREKGGYVSCIGREESPYLRVERQGELHQAQFLHTSIRERITPKAALLALEMEAFIARSGGILLHGAWIALDGEAIVFTAPSGTGKSTQAELWRKFRGAEIINGDRVMIRVRDGVAEAVGIPFAGSSGICQNCTLPIRAVVYLSQAPRNTVLPLRGVKAFRSIWEGCSVHVWNREDVSMIIDTVQKLITAVPVYHLACTPEEAAVAALEAAMKP